MFNIQNPINFSKLVEDKNKSLLNMSQTKKQLHRKISIILLILNFILGGVVVFNSFQRHQQNKLEKTSVLGKKSVIFDPNQIMSDEDFSTDRAFPDADSVQRVLDSFDSPLKNYKENGERASDIIYNAARGKTSKKWNVTPKINPGVMLAYIEKEMSLLSIDNYDAVSDPGNRIKRAMGYGCQDTSKCDQQYFGFANQLNWGAYQLQFNYNLATSTRPDPYKVNNTITTLDEYNVFLSNAATSANYRYTPHVYWGNYNLWKIMTAFGWGENSEKFTYAEIDKVNLGNKDRPAVNRNSTKIKFEEVQTAINTDYTLGQKNDGIKKMQEFLIQQGYLTTRESTGLFGTVTRDAQKNYRRDNGLIGSFVSVDEKECRSLFAKSWRQGEESEEVKKLQRCLRDVGYFDWPVVTGIFGPVTADGLEDVIKALDLKANGVKAGSGSGAVVETQSNTKTSGLNVSNECKKLANRKWTFGSRSEEIKELQKCMQANGYYDWPAGFTGLFGPYTSTQFEKWKKIGQQNVEIVSSGDKLAENSECSSFKKASFTSGERSERIRKLQVCMKDAGFYDWPAGFTGLFGPYTSTQFEKWVKAGTGQTQTTSTSISSECLDLKNAEWVVGERSERVKKLQLCMTDARVFNHQFGATGFFGEVTKKALEDWRK
jgi:peptidoglycan hydrolase-like protein with peptidoglycan-binding domain